jgi:hypothetical protein
MELFLLIAFGLPVVYLVVQVRALRRWEGTARALAWLPVLAAGLYGLNFALDVARDPTSHNLFPFELIIGSVLGLGFLGLCALGRRIVACPER